MNIEASALALKTLKALYKSDRANVYVNPSPVHFTITAMLPPYTGRFLRFTPAGSRTAVTLREFGRRDEKGRVICDGATLAPDWPKGVKPAAGLHDPGYLEIESIAEAWKNEVFSPGYKRDWIARLTARNSLTWTVADVRQLMDMIFGATFQAGGGRRRVGDLYYTGVRLAGALAHRIGRRGAVIAFALCSLSVAGCSGGCMSPPDDFVDFPAGVPELDRVEGMDLGDAFGDIAREAVEP